MQHTMGVHAALTNYHTFYISSTIVSLCFQCFFGSFLIHQPPPWPFLCIRNSHIVHHPVANIRFIVQTVQLTLLSDKLYFVEKGELHLTLHIGCCDRITQFFHFLFFHSRRCHFFQKEYLFHSSIKLGPQNNIFFFRCQL